MKTVSYVYVILIISILGCKKNFLEVKPSTQLLVPTTLDDFRSLLDNTTALNFTSALGHLNSDEYEYVDNAAWKAAGTATERNSYIWAKDIFEGEIQRNDWNMPYQSIFYANNVLQGLQKSSIPVDAEFNQIKGWALFVRAYSFYDLVRTFSSSYEESGAKTDLGIPLRLNPEIDENLPRSSVQQTYDQIIADLKLSSTLLTTTFQATNRNRPSKVSAYAMLARVYLSMNKYSEAELYSDSTLTLYSKLIDYKSISNTAVFPFTNINDETLFSSTQVLASYLSTVTFLNNVAVRISPEIINSYSLNDSRLTVYFGKTTAGNSYRRSGYNATTFSFTGLATDEIFLIKSECLARRGEIVAAMDKLNELLIKRWNPEATVPANAYLKMTANSIQDALNKILFERRKELIWRGLRWSDIKRLNKIGAGIQLKRIVNGTEYSLPPNDPRYIMPIPDDEISRSKIEQNKR